MIILVYTLQERVARIEKRNTRRQGIDNSWLGLSAGNCKFVRVDDLQQ